MKQFSLKTEIKKHFPIVASSLLVFILIVVSCISFYHFIRNYQTNHALAHLEDTSLATTATIKNNLDTSLLLITNVAELAMHFPNTSSEDSMNILHTVTALGNFTHIGITNAQGVSLTTTGGETVDVSSTDFFQQTIAGKACISETLASPFSNSQVFIVSAPIYNQQKVIGIVYGVCDIEQFSTSNSFLENRNMYYNYIIDGNGNFILRSSHKNALVKDESNFWDFLSKTTITKGGTVAELRNNFQGGKSGIVEYGKGDDARIARYSPLDVNNWYVLSVVPRYTLFQSVMDISFVSLGFAGLIAVLFLCLVLIIFYSRRQTQKEITKQRQNLVTTEEMFRIALNQTKLTVFDYDIKTKTLVFKNGDYMGSALPSVMHNVPECLIENGRIDSESVDAFRSLFDQAAAGAKTASAIIDSIHNKTSHWETVTLTNIFDSQEKIIRTVGIIDDITVQLENENSLRYRAERDLLTNLYNRTSIESIVEQFLKTPEAEVGIHAFVYLDLDNFKQINDTLGHAVGDQVLLDVAHKLLKRFRSTDVMARLGGDEFAVFMKNFPNVEALSATIASFIPQMAATYTKEDGSCPVSVSASVGIAITPKDGRSFQELYKKADIALYNVKNTTKNNFAFYTEEE